jgi:hypothetical protein
MSWFDELDELERKAKARLQELDRFVAERDELVQVIEGLSAMRDARSTDSVPAASTPARAPKPPARKRRAASKRKPAAAASDKRKSAATSRAATATAALTSEPPKAAGTRRRRTRSGATASASTATKAAAKPASRGSTSRRADTRAVRSGARPGEREQQLLRLVTKRPGTTVPEIAKDLNVDATGLYGIVKRLEKKGQLRKDGMQLRAVGAAAEAASPTVVEPSVA